MVGHIKTKEYKKEFKYGKDSKSNQWKLPRYIFGKVLQEYKSNHDEKELRFEVDDKSKFNDILHQFGSVNIANNNGTLVYILPIG